MSKKKEQDKFDAYINNTSDAWETDDLKITRRTVDETTEHSSSSSLDSFKQVRMKYGEK